MRFTAGVPTTPGGFVQNVRIWMEKCWWIMRLPIFRQSHMCHVQRKDPHYWIDHNPLIIINLMCWLWRISSPRNDVKHGLDMIGLWLWLGITFWRISLLDCDSLFYINIYIFGTPAPLVYPRNLVRVCGMLGVTESAVIGWLQPIRMYTCRITHTNYIYIYLSLSLCIYIYSLYDICVCMRACTYVSYVQTVT